MEHVHSTFGNAAFTNTCVHLGQAPNTMFPPSRPGRFGAGCSAQVQLQQQVQLPPRILAGIKRVTMLIGADLAAAGESTAAVTAAVLAAPDVETLVLRGTAPTWEAIQACGCALQGAALLAALEIDIQVPRKHVASWRALVPDSPHMLLFSEESQARLEPHASMVVCVVDTLWHSCPHLRSVVAYCAGEQVLDRCNDVLAAKGCPLRVAG